MKLSRLTEGLDLCSYVGQDVEILSLSCDSRTLCAGALFAALEGTKADGNDFIQDVLQKGAAAVLCQSPPPYDGPWLVTDDPRKVFGQMAAAWFGHPARRMTLIGVTGTNGKTTTTTLLKAVLEETLNTKAGLIGTNGNQIGTETLPAERTTPDALTLQALLAQMEKGGCTHVVMEVSSHALALHRTAGLWFAVGIFTNLTRDHLDFHGTMEEYRAAKAKLFRQCRAGFFSLDDETGHLLAETAPCEVHTFSANGEPAEFWAEHIRLLPDGVAFTVRKETECCPVSLPIPGAFTVQNALAVLSCCHHLGIPFQKTAEALASVSGVKGRMEIVPVPAPFTVMLDYAHTPDALEKVLLSLHSLPHRRLLCLFGCGGDRDRSKRPIMGSIAAKLSDLVILTSDNPRSEEPKAIMAEIAAGFPAGFTRFVWEPDRKKAISSALSLGQEGDLLLLAGKGHETWQEIRGEKRHLDEREEITFFFGKNSV